jgi:hypothetical protein
MSRSRKVGPGGWQSIATSPTNGTLCDLRFLDKQGVFEVREPHLLCADGHWYRLDTTMKVAASPSHWRHSSPFKVEMAAQHRLSSAAISKR